MPACFHGPTVARIQTFNGVRGTNDFADFHVVMEEGNESFPRVIPKLHDRWVFRAPFLGHVFECGFGRTRVRCSIDPFEITFKFIPVIT